MFCGLLKIALVSKFWGIKFPGHKRITENRKRFYRRKFLAYSIIVTP